MSQPEDEAPERANRRAFLQNAVTAGAAIAGAGLLNGCATGRATSEPMA